MLMMILVVVGFEEFGIKDYRDVGHVEGSHDILVFAFFGSFLLHLLDVIRPVLLYYPVENIRVVPVKPCPNCCAAITAADDTTRSIIDHVGRSERTSCYATCPANP